MLSILYGLFSAVTWGAADFTGGLASRKAPYFQVVGITWLLGLVIMPLAAIIAGEPLMPLMDWVWCMLAGGFGFTGIMILYRALATGMMSVAAAVSAVMAAVLPVFVGTIVQGFPGWITVLGFAFALAAVWLITIGDGQNKHVRWREVRLPLLAGVGFGVYFILVNRGSQTSIFWPMVATRLTGCLVLSAFMFVKRSAWTSPSKAMPLILINFVLDNMGTLAFILAGQTGRLDIAAVLSSLYPGITIILAWLLLKERMAWVQWVGIALALCAIVLFAI